MNKEEIAGTQGATSEQNSQKGFPRRYYQSWKRFWADLTYMFSHQDRIREAMRSELLTDAFRERLMMAVTEVNQCSYCRTFHVGQARKAGISPEEITKYLKGTIPEDIPEGQKLAVCYAQHWAESDTEPDPELQEQVIKAYGEKGFQAISIVLRMIWMGNLMGNTADYVLYRLSFGKLGV